MSFAFKKFQFLQNAEVPAHAWPRNATCSVPSPRHLYVGCDNGTVHVLDGSFQLFSTFQAHAFRVFYVGYLEERRLLVSVGSEEPGFSSTTVKIWDLPNILANRAAAGASLSGFTPPQQPVRLVKVFSQKHPEGEVTAVAALEVLQSAPADGAPAAAAAVGTTGAVSVSGDVLTLAVGLATGLVYVLLLDLPNAEASKAASAPGKVGPVSSGNQAVKPISVQKLSARPEAGHAWAVNGLALHGSTLDTLALFVVTESQTLSFNLRTNTKSVLDAQGVSAPHCTTLRGPRQVAALHAAKQQQTDDTTDTSEASSAAARAAPPMLMVARDEGLFNYTPDTRAGCTVLEGHKQYLTLLGRFVVVVTQEKTEVGMSSATVMVIDLPHKIISASLTLHSVTAVLGWTQDGVSHASGSVATQGAAGAASASTSKPMLVVVTGSNKLYTFREISLAAQLESLFKRSLHKLALDLARVHHADAATIANIQQRWGDALYSKGEYDAAMLQYSDTIGYLEPSYVIRRFLDAQRIHNLTSYLELLHEKGIAGADHTTLLLNCYTKLKDVDKLDAFVRQSVMVADGVSDTAGPSTSHPPGTGTPTPGSPRAGTVTGAGKKKGPAATVDKDSTSGSVTLTKKGSGRVKKGKKGSITSLEEAKAPKDTGDDAVQGSGSGDRAKKRTELKFDAETAVKVLRAAGYPRHALVVSRAAGHADWELDILTEDLAAWDEALAVMERLPRSACAEALKRVGKVLVSSRPERTTCLIMDLCAPTLNTSGSDHYSGSVGDFAHLFCDAPTGLMLLCEFILNTAPSGAITDERMLYHTLLELYLADTLEDGRSAKSLQADSTQTPAHTATPTAAQPTGAAASSSSGAGASSSGQGVGPGSARVSETGTGTGTAVTGQGLSLPDVESAEERAARADRKERRSKALALLQSGWPPHLEQPKYDQEHALVLCRMAGFKEGLVLLYDRLRLYREVMQVHMASRDHTALLAAVLKYGDVSRGGDPQLWVLLLEYLAQQTTDDVEQRVVEVVEHIEARNILPPIMVLQLLASNPKLQVRSMRGYVARQLARDVSEAARDREAATRLASETASLRGELSRLKSQARVFQASRCSATGQPLELPAVHFMCGHAYNARALGDNDKECPLCSPDYRRVVEIRRNMAASALQQDRFFTELRESSDGFSVVAEHFGRGLMNMTAASIAQQGLEKLGVAVAPTQSFSSAA